MKTLWIYGDSLSTGTHGENAYLTELIQELEIDSLRNFAVGSSGLCETTPNSMVSILKRQLEKNFSGETAPDFVLIWHGSNDWYWGSPLGSRAECAPGSYRGDIAFAVNVLRKQFPHAQIAWATPVFRLEKPDGGEAVGSAYETRNRLGLTLCDYADTLAEAAAHEHFPLIDVGAQAGLHAWNEIEFYEDHVHPNAAGYRRIGRVLTEEIRKCWGVVK